MAILSRPEPPTSLVWEPCHGGFSILRGQILGMRPPELHAGDAAVVRLKPLSTLCVEAFEVPGV